MAVNCGVSWGICATRVTLLDPEGNVADVESNSYSSDQVVSIAMSSNIEEGTSFSRKNGCGCSIARFRSKNIFNWFEFAFEDGALEPAMQALMVAEDEAISDGADVVGVAFGAQDLTCGAGDVGVALEFWSQHIFGGGLDLLHPYVHWVFPMTVWARGDNTAEEDFMAEGHGASRRAVMHNDFVIVGPADDPARVSKASDAPEAFADIAEAEDSFASRADESGTNTKELALWDASGINPKGSWYIETGQGMGETLTIADQKEAYTLSDRGTFLATDNLDSQLLLEGGTDLLNPYHVIVVKGDDLNTACARLFSSWIISPGTQKTIAAFGVAEYGEPLFFPDARG